MLLLTSLVPFFLLAAGTTKGATVKVDNFPVSLGVASRISLGNTLRRDQEHVKRHTGPGKKSSIPALVANVTVPATNDVSFYSAVIGVGKNLTEYTVIIDMASANTWVGANKSNPYKSQTGNKTGNDVALGYLGGNYFTGFEVVDQLKIGNFTIPQQSLGVSQTSFNDSSIDGILGLGPAGLTKGTLSPDNTSIIPTVMDNLNKSGALKHDIFSVSFEPTNRKTNLSGPAQNGELIFGQIDHTKYVGNITYVKTTNTGPSSDFWGINQTVSYGPQNGSANTLLNNSAGIFDAATTFILFSKRAFDLYIKFTGAKIENTTGLAYFDNINTTEYRNLKPLYFTVGDTTFNLTQNAQIWPREFNYLNGNHTDRVYLTVNTIPGYQDDGLTFVNGMAFLQRFYTVYRNDNHQIGIANTKFTCAETN